MSESPIPPQPTVPDDTDWTWVTKRPCPDCGFDPAAVTPETVPGLINAGVYLLARRTIAALPRQGLPLSFETEVFPQLLQAGVRLQVTPAQGAFLDIGTEASLAQADRFIRDNQDWFPPNRERRLA